jgi:hypothetical protein
MKTDNKKKRWYHNDIDWKYDQQLVIDWSGLMQKMFLLLLCLALVTSVAVLLIDNVNLYRSQPARFACEARQMQARRYTFTDSVVCVPYPTRRDTTTLEVPRGE